MHISTAPLDGASLVTIDGEFLGALGGPALRETVDTLINERRYRVVLDLRHCALMDSAGLGVLIESATALRDRGGDLRVAVREGRLRRLFTMTGLLGRVFAVYPTVEDAVDGWDVGSGD